MYPNLMGQKAFHKLTNDDMAAVIGRTRETYEAKLRTGDFTVDECKKYMLRFGKSFDYLFARDEDI